MKTQVRDELLQDLKARFEKNRHRHQGVSWSALQARLEASPDALRSLQAMESTGGEPDVIGQDQDHGHVTFCDCSAESPAGRRSVCHDRDARDLRKEHKPHRCSCIITARRPTTRREASAVPSECEP